MASVLKIGGVVVDRAASRLTLHSVTFSMDGPETLEFSQTPNPAGCGDFSAGQSVSLADSDYAFIGTIVKAIPQNIGLGSIAVGYTAFGLRWEANNLWVTAADGTGSMTFNLPVGDPHYVPTRSGLSVGIILQEILDQHAAALAAIGITGYTASELTALTVVPPEPFTAAGRLMDACADLLTQWCPNHAIWSDGAGLLHVKDTSTLPATTLTLDVDPITLESISKDHSESFTQVKLRGVADIQAAYLSLAEHTLTWAQLPADVSTWTTADFFTPKGASDWGKIVSMTSSSITCKSDDPTAHAAVNYISSIGATVWAFNPIATGIDFSEQVTATASTALVAGGTYTITVQPAFNNSGYTRYQVRGNRTVQSLTWRKLNIVPTWVAAHLCPGFDHSFPWSPVDGVDVQTNAPTGVVCWYQSGSTVLTEFPWLFEIVLPDGTNPGYLVLNQPAPLAYESQANLTIPGASSGPADVKVIVPYSLGPLEVIAPSGGGYAGTAHAADGVARTYYREYPTWDDRGNSASMQILANEILKSLQDTVYEGALTYHGRAGAWLTLGKALNIARARGTTGWESIAAAVRSVSLQWPSSGGDIWRTVLNFSSRRKPFTGDRLYMHPAYGTHGALAGNAWNPFGLTTQKMLAISQARQQQFEEQYLTPPSGQDDLGIEFEGPEKQRMTRAQAARKYDRDTDAMTGDQEKTERQKQHDRAVQREKDRKAGAAATAAAHEEARSIERPGEEMAKAQRQFNRDAESAKRKDEEKLAREGKLPVDMGGPDEETASR